MGRLTNYQMSYLLSLKTHREKYPVVQWIEAEIANGSANTDFGESCKDVIDEVRVHYGGREDLDYWVDKGKVVAVILGPEFFEDNANPTKEEFDLLEVVHPKWHQDLRNFCEELPEYFNHPHSCIIDYQVKEADCSGCGRRGPVNWHDGDGTNWKNYCNGGPHCRP